MAIKTRPTANPSSAHPHSDSDSDIEITLVPRLSHLSLQPKEAPQSPTKLRGGEKKSKKAKTPKIVREFDEYFGEETKLENWQRLCKDLSIDPVPTSLTQCRKALRKVWVNIVDFIENKANGTPQRFFASRNELAKYTIKTRRIYPKRLAKDRGPIKELLAHIF